MPAQQTAIPLEKQRDPCASPSDLIDALKKIARGSTNYGLAAEHSRQIARNALVKAGLEW